MLHPTDLSSSADAAFAHGLRIALAVRGIYTIVHTTDTADAGNEWRKFPKVREQLIAWGLLRSDASENDVADLGLRVMKVDLRIADIKGGIAAYADRHGCDLIVLSTHARQGMQRWRSQRVAEPLARKVKAPTLFLPDGAVGFVDGQTGEVRLHKILVPVDFSPDPGRAVDIATSLAASLNATDVVITLLHVGEDFENPPLRPLEGVALRWLRREGRPVDAILGAIRDIAPDLVVMATRGHDDFLDALRGSTTEQVLRRSGCALLAVPEHGASREF